MIGKIKENKNVSHSFSVKQIKKPTESTPPATGHMHRVLKEYLRAQQQVKELVETYQIRKSDLEKELKELEETIAKNIENQVEVETDNAPKSNYLLHPQSVKKSLTQTQFKKAFTSSLEELLETVSQDNFSHKVEEFVKILEKHLEKIDNKTTKIQLRKKCKIN